MSAEVSPSPFARAQPDLARLGYSAVIPVIPPTWMQHAGRGKAPGEVSSGGWRGLSGWQKFRTAAPSSFQIGLWSRMPEANVGLLLGTPAGGESQIVALDIDVTDADELELLQSVLPRSPMSKRAAKGVTLLYRAALDVSSRSYDRAATETTAAERLVDLLAAGRHTCVPPSRHPAGVDYQWLTGPVPANELPLLTDADIEKLEDTLESLGWLRDGRASDSSPTGGRAPLAPYDPADPWSVAKARALADLDRWFPDLCLPGTRRARGGWEAIPAWRASSTGRPLEMRKRNLSASSIGIRDWGAGGSDAGLTAIDVVQRALDLTASEALVWLQEKLGIEEEDDGIVISLQMPDSKTPPAALEVAATEGVEVLGGARILAEAVGGSTHDRGDLPEHLLQSCPGLLGGIVDYIVASARKPQPTLALGAALAILGTAAGRRYAGPTESGTHLYLFLSGASGVGKEHPLDMMSRILQAADMGQHVGPSEFMSFQAAFTALQRQPLLCCPMDEIGTFFGRCSRRGAAGNEAALTGVLRTAWGKSFAAMASPGWATRDVGTIYAPALTILGASTPDELFKSLETGAIESGFLNRWLLFPTFDRPEARSPAADKFAVPQQIVDGLKAIYNVGGPIAQATMHTGRCDAPMVKVEWEGGEDGPLAREFYAWAATLDEQSDNESLFARCAEQTIRVATIRAIGSDATAPVVDRQCFDWAREIVLWSTRAMVSHSADFMAENQTQADRARVLRAIKKAGTISHRDLTRKLTIFKARELEEIVKMLEGAELVQTEKVVNPTNSKTTKRYTFTGGAEQ